MAPFRHFLQEGRGAGHGLELEGAVTDAAPHRAAVVERRAERPHSGQADAAVGGLQPDDAAARRGQADRAAGVGRESEVAEACSQRGRVAAAGASGSLVWGDRIPHGSVPRVLARHAPRELVQVRLSDHDGPRGDKPLGRRRRPRRHVLRVDA